VLDLSLTLLDPSAGPAAFGADHAVAERPYRRVFGQMISIHRDAVVAFDRAAIDQYVATAEAAHLAERNRGGGSRARDVRPGYQSVAISAQARAPGLTLDISSLWFRS
jgi:hypothetical protein